VKHRTDRSDDDWLDNLDAVLAGKAAPPNDEELLHVATRLASALSPLRAIARDDPRHAPRQLPAAHHRQFRQPTALFSPRARRPVAMLVALACIIGLVSVIGSTTLWQGVEQTFHASTSLEQIDGVSLASLAPPHAGLKPLPLLPAALPVHTQASLYGVLTDASNPDIMTTFVADYHINGEDVLLYEQPSDVPFLSTTAQNVRIGTRQGQLFEDSAGNHALQWYQDAMLCQITSKLAVTQLLQLARSFQPIKSWDLLRT
jgi:hypothetical protein